MTRALATGLRVVCLFPAMHRSLATTSESAGLWKRPVRRPRRRSSSTAGVLSVGIRRKLGLPSRFEGRFGQPLDVQALASNWPALPFIIPHFGAGFFREALMAADIAGMCCSTPPARTTGSSTRRARAARCLQTCPSRVRRRSPALRDRLLVFPPGWQRPVFEAQSAAVDALGVTAAIASSFSAARSTGSFARHPETLSPPRTPSDEARTAQVEPANSVLVNSARRDRFVVGPSQMHTRHVVS